MEAKDVLSRGGVLRKVATESGELVPCGADAPAKVVPPGGGLRRESVPGESLYFKLSGDDCASALDYLELQIAPGSGPPLHVHHVQHETIHFLEGDFKVQVGDALFDCPQGSFVYFPVGVKHAFVNLSAVMGRCILTFVPGGSHNFFAEFGPAVRAGQDEQAIAKVFERWDWEVVGPPLTAERS